ncbi:MAG: aminoglycoside phosphotransferase (APT) family kinase protein [Candidatus Poriferisodalaceae bacterium]|jgi:aminoglycoside phosphotransferase (APT) family kinase protein
MGDVNSTIDPAVINDAAITKWLGERAEIQPPLRYDLVAGGRSNMTFVVVDAAGRSFVLRRPPMGPLLPSAHDMSREHRLMHALRDSEVPVPMMVGLCQDDTVNGRDFYMMEFLDGVVVRDIEIGREFSEAERTQMCHSLVDTLCALHRVDIDEVGLGNLAKREGYIERQVRRWSGQWEQSKTRELPIIDEVAAALTAKMPRQARTTIAHGDYRLSNCMMTRSGDVMAVLDWELCTLGDPMADLGLLLCYWNDPDDPEPAGDAETTSLPGFMTGDELAELYATEMNVNLDAINYYRGFAHWRLACISEGVYSRYLAGQQGVQDEELDLDAMRDGVAKRSEKAASYLL